MKRILTAMIGIIAAVGMVSACAPVEEAETPTIPPVEEVASAAEMSEKLGFEMQTLDAPGYRAVRFEVLNGERGQITYENSRGQKLCLRMQKVNDDICGIEDAEDGGMQDVGESKVWFGYKDDLCISQWGQDGYTYCLIGEGLNRTPFRRVANLLEAQVNAEEPEE